MIVFLHGLDALTASKRGPQAWIRATVVRVREDIVFSGQVRRLDVGRGGAADAAEATHHEVAIPGAQALVGEAVDEEVDAGVQVRDHRRVEVNRQRKYVEIVGQQNDNVRRPTHAKSDEDDEDYFHLPDGLDDRRLGGPRSQTTVAADIISRLQNA